MLIAMPVTARQPSGKWLTFELICSAGFKFRLKISLFELSRDFFRKSLLKMIKIQNKT